MDMIDKYAHHLKSMGMHGVMVHGMTGEGTVMTMEERMRMTEKWHEATRKYDMKMLVNIGGMDLPSVYMMAEHAEKLKVDAVMMMPDMFYKPMTEEDLMMYMKDVMMHMPTRPVMYYHIPMMTHVNMDMHRFMHMMDKENTMFAGLYWTHEHMDMLMMMKQKMPHMNYIIGTMSSMMGWMAEGMEAISMTAMNMMPEMMKEMYNLMMNKKMNEAMMVHDKMNKRIWDMFRMENDMHMDMDWMMMMRMEMEKMFPTMKMGPMRRPKMTMNKMW